MFCIQGHPEFDGWRWVSYWYPVRQVVSFKRDVYRRVMKEFAPACYAICSARRASPPTKIMMLMPSQRIVEGVNKALDFNMALNTMVGQVREALETDSCSVFIGADNDQRQFVMAASDGSRTEDGLANSRRL